MYTSTSLYSQLVADPDSRLRWMYCPFPLVPFTSSRASRSLRLNRAPALSLHAKHIPCQGVRVPLQEGDGQYTLACALACVHVTTHPTPSAQGPVLALFWPYLFAMNMSGMAALLFVLPVEGSATVLPAAQ